MCRRAASLASCLVIPLWLNFFVSFFFFQYIKIYIFCIFQSYHSPSAIKIYGYSSKCFESKMRITCLSKMESLAYIEIEDQLKRPDSNREAINRYWFQAYQSSFLTGLKLKWKKNMTIESDELIWQLSASLALPYSLLNYRNARLKTVMLCLIYCAYQDGFYLHIPDYPVPETEAPMLAALTPPSERSYYTSLVLKEKVI